MVPLRGIFSDAKKLKVIQDDPMDECKEKRRLVICEESVSFFTATM